MFQYKVLKFNHNKKEIEFWDIGPTVTNLFSDIPSNATYEDFSQTIEIRLQSRFWARCEYEVVVSDWPNGTTHRKIDIYEQIKANWEIFINQAFKEFRDGSQVISKT